MQRAVDHLAGPLHRPPVPLAARDIGAADHLLQEILYAGREGRVVLELEEDVQQRLFVSGARVGLLRVEDAGEEEELDEGARLGREVDEVEVLGGGGGFVSRACGDGACYLL